MRALCHILLLFSPPLPLPRRAEAAAPPAARSGPSSRSSTRSTAPAPTSATLSGCAARAAPAHVRRCCATRARVSARGTAPGGAGEVGPRRFSRHLRHRVRAPCKVTHPLSLSVASPAPLLSPLASRLSPLASRLSPPRPRLPSPAAPRQVLRRVRAGAVPCGARRQERAPALARGEGGDAQGRGASRADCAREALLRGQDGGGEAHRRRQPQAGARPARRSHRQWLKRWNHWSHCC